MKKNELIQIAGQDFLFNTSAAEVVRDYLASVKKRNRFKPNAKRALEETLRDVLMSYETKRSVAITKPKIHKAISIVGNTFEETGIFDKLLALLKAGLAAAFNWFVRLAGVRKFQVITYAVLSVIFILVSVSLITSAFDRDWWQVYQEPASTGIETTIGYVRSTNWADFPEMPSYPSSKAQNIAGFVACLLFALIFLMLAKRSKHKLPVLVVAVITTVAWGFLAYDTAQDRKSFTQSVQTSTFATMDTVRTTQDLDYLQVCGTEINYVMGSQAGKLFYDFQDLGFTLAKELKNQSSFTEPTRADICTAYDELRRSYPDEQIVLQTFIRDTSGTIRPFDYDEKYLHANGTPNRYPMRYGFFTKTK